MPSHLAKSRAREISPRKTSRIVNRIGRHIPPDLKAIWVSKYRDRFEAAFGAMLDEHDPSAVRVFAEMAGAVGAPGQIVLNLLAVLGVKSEDEAKGLILQGRRMLEIQQDASASLEMILEEALETALLVISERPDLKAVAAARLGLVEAVIPLVSNGHLGQ